jgi:hypothetical protein
MKPFFPPHPSVATEDARALHVAERSVLRVADPEAGRLKEARAGAAPAACMDQRIDDNAP